MPLVAFFLLLISVTQVFAQTAGQAPVANEDSVEVLIQILENDEARGALIEKLRAGAEGQAGGSAALAASDFTIINKITEYSRAAVEGAADLGGTVISLGGQLVGVLSGATAIDMQDIWRTLGDVALVLFVTFLAYFTLRLGFRRFQRLLAETAMSSGIIRRIGVIALAAAADTVTVIAAWAIGNAVALYFTTSGQMGFSRTLFLNAFLFIELAKVLARVLLAPRWPALRIGHMDDTTAAYWYFWVSRLVSVIGYTFLFLAPILQANVSTGAAEAFRVVVLFCALTMACIIILQNRDTVRAWLMRHGERGQSEPLVRMLMGIARFWHIVAIGYLILIFMLWVANREAALPFVVLATVESIVALAIGLALTFAVVRLIAGGMQLPADIRQRLPLLERRLNAYVPNVLRVVRIVVMCTVVLAIAQIWRMADLIGWLSSGLGQRVVTSAVSAIFILLVGGLTYLAVQSWVEYRLSPPNDRVPSPRERTLLGLFRNAFTIALSVLVFMLVLSELGVNIAPLLAGAGIIGLAVGFGAQKLVQDVINGAFIQFENAMNEGDVVTVGGITGSVERLTIRSVSLRAVDGAYHLIPFSSVDAVTNYARNFSYHVAAIGVDYSANISEVKKALHEAFERLQQTQYGENMLGDLEMHGVTEFADSAIVVRARIKTKPGQQWALGRAYNEIIKEVFDERGIEIPFPHMTLYMPESKQKGLSLTTTPEGPRKKLTPRKRRESATKPVASPTRRGKKIAYDGPDVENHEAADGGDEVLA